VKQQRNFIGRPVARMRNERGMTQDAFADRLQFAGWHEATRSTVSKIEDGSLRIDLLQLYYIAVALGVQPMQLLSEINWSRGVQEITHSNDDFIPKYAADHQERIYGNR
jgi:transcriptional regulator with XRE-family HTH domain